VPRCATCSPTGANRPRWPRSTTVTGRWSRPCGRRSGLAGLLVPEELGGAGASALEAAVVLEGVGRACAPVPFLTSAVVATTALLATEADAARSALAAVASGDRTAALIVPLSTEPDGALPEVELADGHLTGSVRSVAGALEADLLLVPARAGDGDGVVLVLVDRTDADVTPVSSLDMARQLADVSFVGVAGEVASTDAEAAVREASDRCRAAGVRAGRCCPLVPGGDLRLPQGAPAAAGCSVASKRSSTASPTCTPRSSRPGRRRGTPPRSPRARTSPSRRGALRRTAAT